MRKRRGQLLTACAVGIIVAALLARIGPSFSEGNMTDCAPLTLEEEPYQTTYDSDTGLLGVTYFDPDTGESPTITFDPRDPVCRAVPGLAPKINDALATHREQQANRCETVRDNLRREVTRARGREFDQVAAESYLDLWCGEYLENHWELLAETPAPTTKTTHIPIQRGLLPATTTRFNPQPSATFEVAGRVQGATGTAKWTIQLREGLMGANLTIGEVVLGPGDTEFTVKSGPLGYYAPSGFKSWPDTRDWRLDALWATPSTGSNAASLTGTLEIKKAYIKLQQDEPVRGTVGRYQLASKQTVRNTDWADIIDPIIYRHEADDFDPAPTVKLRVGGVAGSGVGDFRLVDASGQPVGSVGTIDLGAGESMITPGESVEVPVTLADGGEYHLQVRTRGTLLPSWDLLSADLLFEQSVAAPSVINETVSWFAGMITPANVTANGAATDSLFRAPAISANAAYSWFATIRGASGASGAAISLYNKTDVYNHSQVAPVSADYTYTEAEVTSPPVPRQVMDTISVLDPANPWAARVAIAGLRVAMNLPAAGEFAANSAPSLGTVSVSPSSATAGTLVNFTVAWSDPNDRVQVFICRTNAIDAGLCEGGHWAAAPLSTTSPVVAELLPIEEEVGTHTYYAFVCDSAFACSGSSSGTFTIVSGG